MELGLVLNASCYEFFRRKCFWSQSDSTEIAVEVFKVRSQHTSSTPRIHVPLAFGVLGLFSTVLTSYYVLEPHAVARLCGGWLGGTSRNDTLQQVGTKGGFPRKGEKLSQKEGQQVRAALREGQAEAEGQEAHLRSRTQMGCMIVHLF